jgi:hypothetical protein
MVKCAIVFLLAATVLTGCKTQASSPEPSTVAEAAPPQYGDPPTVATGLSVEQAYAAIPHRRTVWVEGESAVPAAEKAYLKVVFQVLDQATMVRVAGLQNYSSQHFDYSDPESDYERLITFVRNMPAPKKLETYHKDILEGLAGQQQFFKDWRSQGEHFAFAQQIGNHPGVQKASGALRSAYNELMARYPNEAQTNKDAFFDYHCALDFL